MATNQTDARRITRNHEHTHAATRGGPDLSSGWREVYAALEVDSSIEPDDVAPDAIAAATRTDRPARYRRKHALEVTT